MCIQGVSVGEAGERVALREVPDSFRLALPDGNIPQHCAVLNAVDPLPFGETGFERECLAILPEPFDLHHHAAGRLKRTVWELKNRTSSTGRGAIGRGVELAERLPDNFLGLVAENRLGSRVPDRNQAFPVDAQQTIAKRHRDPLEALFCNAAQQTSKVDLVESDGDEISQDHDVEDRGVDDDAELRLQKHRAQFTRDRRGDQNRNPQTGGTRPQSAIMTSTRIARPPSVMTAEEGCSARPCRIVSAASTCSNAPEIMRPFGT